MKRKGEYKKMKNFKNNKGITLVALIITIIVLLILAVVAISAVNGDGIISKAKIARKNYQEAQGEENSALAGYQETLDSINNEGNGGGSSSGELKAYAAAAKDGSGYLTENAKYTDGENAVATIPAGFKVSEVTGEQTIKTGLVIKDSEDNEFVWVPVANISDMAQLQSGSETNYEGILYNFTSSGSTTMGIRGTDYGLGTVNFREPAKLYYEEEWDDGDESGTNIYDDGDYGITQEGMQIEFNSMVASVSKYKGFYVARYELSTTAQGKLASKKGATVTTEGTDDNMWYGLYNICKTYNVTNSVQSNMIYGCQYDAMLRWMQNANIDVTSDSVVSKNTSETYTGIMDDEEEDKDILNNVYDLLGGHSECTQEAFFTLYRISRGGFYNVDYSFSASYRGDYENFDNTDFPDQANNGYSARSALYIK